MRLPEKTAIVTGAAHGIGKAIAELFAEEGAWVLVADLDDAAGEATAADIRGRGGRAAFRHVDVADEAQVAAAAQQAADAGNGRVDVLCNNASHLNEWHDVVSAPPDEWDRYLRVGLLGTAHFLRAVLPLMVARRSGSVVNVASIQGLVAGRSSAAYTATKHAIIGLTRSVACDYAPYNIRVNAVCPGPIATRISPPPGTELHDRQIAKTPLGRVGEPREVAYAALFLATDESSYVTGAVLPVDGGWTTV